MYAQSAIWMNAVQSKTLNFWHRYVLALCLIASTSICIFAVSRWAGTTADAYTNVINIAGRQRMLSQRIAYLSLNPFTQAQSQSQLSDTSKRRAALKDAITQFETAHLGLTRGDLALKLDGEMDPALTSFYFAPSDALRKGDGSLDARSKAFIAAAREGLNGTSASAQMARSEMFRSADATLLADLNMAVSLWEAKAKAASHRLRTIEAAALAITLTLLALEALFIFWPTYQAMQRAVKQAEDERDSAISAKAAAALAASARIRFLEHMTHELRTPLTAIIGRSEIIVEDANSMKPNDSGAQSIEMDASKIGIEARKLLDFIEAATDDAITCSGGYALEKTRLAA
jgi:signal transduction histidine kinase